MASPGVSSLQNLQALSALLSTQEEEEEEDPGCKNVAPCSQLNPGHIGPQPKTDQAVSNANVTKTKNIWNEEEVAEGSHLDDHSDPRPQPEYDIILKQSVGTEDIYLGLSRKDPSSMCCEAMLIKIRLPETKATDVVLDVKEKFLDLRTPKYKLGLHLPHPVHSQEGKAQFFSDRDELEVTLLLNRPMDSINMQ